MMFFMACIFFVTKPNVYQPTSLTRWFRGCLDTILDTDFFWGQHRGEKGLPTWVSFHRRRTRWKGIASIPTQSSERYMIRTKERGNTTLNRTTTNTTWFSYQVRLLDEATASTISLPMPLPKTYSEELYVRKMDPNPIYFGFWCLMTNTTKLDKWICK